MLRERLKTFTTLGIQFWDAVRDVPIRDGLAVVSWSENAPDYLINGFRTMSGMYALRNFPGLRDIEYPMETAVASQLAPVVPKRFVVAVEDLQSRFRSLNFTIDLPLPYPGLYRPGADASPPQTSSARFHLLPGDRYLPDAGLAVLYAELVLAGDDNNQPAAHALVELTTPGGQAFGLADERGCVTVLFPYPHFLNQLETSPPGIPITSQSWQISVAIRYQPSIWQIPRGSTLPDFRTISDQSHGQIWSAPGMPQNNLTTTVYYGAAQTLRTDSAEKLWVTPAP